MVLTQRNGDLTEGTEKTVSTDRSVYSVKPPFLCVKEKLTISTYPADTWQSGPRSKAVVRLQQAVSGFSNRGHTG